METREKDTYLIQIDNSLSQDSLFSLYSLYQPLLTMPALTLYLTLYCEGGNQRFAESHQRLLTLMKMDMETFQKARLKLEEYVLLRVFEKTEEQKTQYIYQLLPPLSTKAFLSSVFMKFYLSSFPKKEVEITLTKIQNREINFTGYREVTHKMKYISKKVESENDTLMKVKPRYSSLQTDETIQFDYESFFAKIDNLTFPLALRTKENLALIGKMATIHGLSVDKIIPMVVHCSTFEPASFDTEKFRNVCSHSKPDILSAVDVYSLPPVSFLQSKQEGVMVSQIDRKLLVHLSEDYAFSNEVINVLIDYVLQISNNRLIRNFVDMVASSWKRDGVKNKQDALKEIKKQQPSTKKQFQEAIPSYYNPSPIRNKEEKASAEKIQKAQEILRNGGKKSA